MGEGLGTAPRTERVPSTECALVSLRMGSLESWTKKHGRCDPQMVSEVAQGIGRPGHGWCLLSTEPA